MNTTTTIEPSPPSKTVESITLVLRDMGITLDAAIGGAYYAAEAEDEDGSRYCKITDAETATGRPRVLVEMGGKVQAFAGTRRDGIDFHFVASYVRAKLDAHRRERDEYRAALARERSSRALAYALDDVAGNLAGVSFDVCDSHADRVRLLVRDHAEPITETQARAVLAILKGEALTLPTIPEVLASLPPDDEVQALIDSVPHD